MYKFSFKGIRVDTETCYCRVRADSRDEADALVQAKLDQEVEWAEKNLDYIKKTYMNLRHTELEL